MFYLSLNNYFVLLGIFLCVEITGVQSGAPTTKEEAILRGRQRFGGEDNEKDYEYEILTGHKKVDNDKAKRQLGCMCVDHFYDPHCGDDLKTYDNGCFFLCGQERNPGLKLLNWGKCDDAVFDDGSHISNKLDVDFDYEEGLLG